MVLAWTVGDHIALVYPRGAYGEKWERAQMDKSVFWNLKAAQDKLFRAYVDMDEKPEMAKQIRQMGKDLDVIIKEVDKNGWD